MCMDNVAGQPKSLLDLSPDNIKQIADYCSPLDRCSMRKTCKTLSATLEETREQDVVVALRKDVLLNRYNYAKITVPAYLERVDKTISSTNNIFRRSGLALGTATSIVATGFLVSPLVPVSIKFSFLTPIIVAAPLLGFLTGRVLSFPARFMAAYLTTRSFKKSFNTDAELKRCNFRSRQYAPSNSLFGDCFIDLLEKEGFLGKSIKYTFYGDFVFSRWTARWIMKNVMLQALPAQ